MATGWMRRLRQVTGDRAGLAQRALETVGRAERASAAGDREAARQLGETAVTELRSLVASGVREAGSGLVRALLNQSEYLRLLSRHAEAVAAADEAVSLAWADPGRPRALALALATLAARLLAADRPADGSEAARQALAIGGVQPDAELAQVLVTLAAMLAEAGEHEAALAPSERAAGMWRVLAAGNDRESRFRLGQALAGHAGRLYAAGHWADAIEFSAEAVAIRRGLAGESPETLALGLTDHAMMLRRVGREQEARAAAAEAASLAPVAGTGDGPAGEPGGAVDCC
ncbi:hypothetical protein ACTOB_001857 [Actinoplanes oblitus]|uniref:MalT-like TPR region domain-containing protein n=1 Tax=Actinoplanes oblitus TaxID=3040509 RepID=A0ABY8WN54_9ACTN|nr:hypothetical protein [Actinoplanes oblitus]WIM98262.1 hypothetical protein ACTOB_001857 [Actinoplanes oblitus]